MEFWSDASISWLGYNRSRKGSVCYLSPPGHTTSPHFSEMIHCGPSRTATTGSGGVAPPEMAGWHACFSPGYVQYKTQPPCPECYRCPSRAVRELCSTFSPPYGCFDQAQILFPLTGRMYNHTPQDSSSNNSCWFHTRLMRLEKIMGKD